jgi:hypothetical protein
VTLVAALFLLLSVVVWADDRTVLKPGWNMFSTEQDVEVGQQVSQDAERQLRLLNNSRVDTYINNLGRRLAAKATGARYPYHFSVVNDRAINAFALPGGPVYINRGVMEAADNESQLAGVLAHEIAHIALRHGTNQASKAATAQVPLAILGGLLGNDSTKTALAQLGASFAVNSVLLKYSRTAESEADILGTQILHDAGYDPRAMAQFFEQIQARQKGSGPVEFFSNHPSPDNRIERVTQEVNALGGVLRGSDVNARAFDETTRYLQSLPVPRGQPVQAGRPSGTAADLRIVSASYGASSRFIDVRERMQSRVVNDRLDLLVNNSSMGGDPVSQAKALHLRYQWDDRAYDVSVQEGSRLSIPTVPQARDTNGAATGNGNVMTPDWPSERFVGFENSLLRITHPDNWDARGQGDAMTITPRGGLIDDGQGRQALAYGVIVSVFETTRRGTYGQSLQGRGYGQPAGQLSTTRLDQSTDQLVQELRLSNRTMRVIRDREAVIVDGDQALSTYLSNDSPTGVRETDWLVTVERPEGLLFVIFTAPERDFPGYERTFEQMLRSIRIKR